MNIDRSSTFVNGPSEEMERHEYSPQILRPTTRSKIKLYSANPGEFDMTKSRFFSF